MHLQYLHDLLHCHSTPGDEAEVRDWLERHWRGRGWQVEHHGHYAISARPAAIDPALPTLLITAHMDSPGFCVERIKGDELTLIRLGGTRLTPGTVSARGRLKTRRGTYSVLIEQHHDADGKDTWTCSFRGQAIVGDRVCWEARPQLVNDAWILSPFLDNRLGCYLLAEIAAHPALQADGKSGGNALPVNLVLGATGTEEMGGYGAAVMAAALRPDLAICLDATYEFPEQDVHMGHGPVLTLSDAAILLSPATRDALQDWCAARGLPMQAEAYNYAGTDARAFPHQGLPGAVLAILVATTGNHTQIERCSVADLRSLLELLAAIAKVPAAEWPLAGSPTP